MADAPHPQCSLSSADETRLRAKLEAAGHRFTRHRAAVFAYLKSVVTHPTAEEVHHAVQDALPHISLATVYNTLEALVEAKLIAKITGYGPARYDYRTENHYHFRCLTTGQVRDIDIPHDPTLISKLAPTLLDQLRACGMEVTDYRLELVGHCSSQLSANS